MFPCGIFLGAEDLGYSSYSKSIQSDLDLTDLIMWYRLCLLNLSLTQSNVILEQSVYTVRVCVCLTIFCVPMHFLSPRLSDGADKSCGQAGEMVTRRLQVQTSE